jgi:hypothetical protein
LSDFSGQNIMLGFNDCIIGLNLWRMKIMKMNRVLSTLLAFILLACLSGVQGQYAMPLSSSSTTSSAAQSTSLYSEYYNTLTGSIPSAHILPPVQFNLTGKTPTNVYFGTQMQQVPYSTYQPTASGNILWIQGATDWSQYAVVPQGAVVSLLAITPNEGSGNFVLLDSNGPKYNYSYFIYHTSQLSFYADAPGRHTLSFIAGGVASNPVVIDVSGTVTMTYTPTGNYYPPLINNPVDYLGGYYPGNYVPRVSYGPQAALDNAAANKEYQKKFGSGYNYYNGDNPYAWDYATNQWLNFP